MARLYWRRIIRLWRTCILNEQATIVRLIICLCINTDKQTGHPSIQVIWIIRVHRRTIQIDGWSVVWTDDPSSVFCLRQDGYAGLSGGPLDGEGLSACRTACSTFLKHGGGAHDANLLCRCYSWWPSWRRSRLTEARCRCGSTFGRRTPQTAVAGALRLQLSAARTSAGFLRTSTL